MIPCMELAWTPRRQGDAGELSAIKWLFSAGAEVYVPLFTGPDVDLIADFGDRVDRVQVKTSTCWVNNRFVVTHVHAGWQQELERARQATRAVAVRLGVRRTSATDAAGTYLRHALGGGRSIRVGGPEVRDV